MGATPGSQPPPPPMWMPMPVQAPAQRMTFSWTMISFWGRALGFVLLFLGTFVAVVASSEWGGCITDPASCGTSWLAGVLNGIVVAKILWVIGLFFLGAGAGIKLHWGLHMPTTGKAEEVAYVQAERRATYLLVLVSVVLLIVLLFTVNMLPPH